ncbi:TRAP transporter small permease [Undibacterium sp.]|jgi:TRAP-type C4-dicarboxylate transport system permease small subunit|uniref:TRAP transporter small permease n=1 Tax=Undibacterium sp. TaxID=1914977 RepID=UPI002C290BC5|nr:TRAP transporter small permease [Undibacterium sp.]HTD03707.1 TRAP transporter small permease [Undibacterium sp.]
MSHGFELEPTEGPARPDSPALAGIQDALNRINLAIVRVSMAAMLFTALILTYSVVVRYFFKVPTDWQDEASVFLLIGVTFFSAAYVQSHRGHIGIEVLSSLLPAFINRLRLILVDILSFAFCAFFCWKSWTLFHEAWVDGQTTSSTLAPPLWIPYSMMSLGMTLLSLQILVQVLAAITATAASAAPTAGKRA